MTIIYGLSSSNDPDNIRYIGKTNNIVNRLKRHLSKYNLKIDSYKNRWINMEISNGNEIHIKELFRVDEKINWQKVEVEWIKKYKELGYELTNGTLGDGFDLTPEIINKRNNTIIEKNILDKQREIEEFNIEMKDGKWTANRICPSCMRKIYHFSKTFSGIIHLLRKSKNRKCLSCRSTGKKLSDEAKQKISKSKENISQITRNKLSKIHKGKIISQETKDKISKSLIGRKVSEDTKLKMSISRNKRNEKNKISAGDSTYG